MSDQTATRSGRVALVVMAAVLDVVYAVLVFSLVQAWAYVDQATAWITIVILGLVVLFFNIMMFKMATSTESTEPQEDPVSPPPAWAAPIAAPAKNPGQAVIVIALVLLTKWVLRRAWDKKTSV